MAVSNTTVSRNIVEKTESDYTILPTSNMTNSEKTTEAQARPQNSKRHELTKAFRQNLLK